MHTKTLHTHTLETNYARGQFSVLSNKPQASACHLGPGDGVHGDGVRHPIRMGFAAEESPSKFYWSLLSLQPASFL